MTDPDDAARIHEQTRAQWTSDPAGALAVDAEELGSPESFHEVERYRYVEQPWMHDTFHFERYRGQRLLEIGVGLGTDHLQFARAGAICTGVDLTPRSIEMTGKRFAQEGFESDLRLMDAEHLDFPDDAFDVVYSFGVLHHVPSSERAFAEVRRVLRPGGVFIGALYSAESLIHLDMRVTRLLKREYKRETWPERLARVEYSTSDAVPHVRLFTAKEVRQVLGAAGFDAVRTVRRHSGYRHATKDLPTVVETTLGRLAGWYVVHEAR